MAQRFRVVSAHPEDIACGQVLAPGEVSRRVRPSDPHDQRLISEGRLVLMPPKRQKKSKTQKQEESR